MQCVRATPEIPAHPARVRVDDVEDEWQPGS
ncbi:hypothetical protein Rrhod_3229 [Rhodococcus rhodnii LMG 5362]|uniref:Uncharacterized protein n=1 Tax=Rhodococcus rhodnii LMG 5362 TaxID=1273125 RepID=R7WJF9_9NOCA|nr:hypothetical protein Rrhod_3229 [Rhodococcus rhodnii LMG 5362]